MPTKDNCTCKTTRGRSSSLLEMSFSVVHFVDGFTSGYVHLLRPAAFELQKSDLYFGRCCIAYETRIRKVAQGMSKILDVKISTYEPLTIVCFNNHVFSLLPKMQTLVLEWLSTQKIRYTDLVCPVCRVSIRNVICKKCQHCVPPFSPCKCMHPSHSQPCGADPLIADGPC